MKNNINSTDIVTYSDNKSVIEPGVRTEPLMIDAIDIECEAHVALPSMRSVRKEDLPLSLVKVTRLPSVKKPNEFHVKLISEIIEEIRGDSLKEPTKKCRELALIKQQDAQKAERISEGNDDFEAAQVQASKSKREYNNLKKTLPCCCFHGIFEGKVTNENLIRFSGLAAIDIDNLDKQGLEKARQIITTLESCVICYTTPSGRGLKACIWVGKQAIMDDAAFKMIFAKLEFYFKGRGIIVDSMCKDIRRVHFLTHDPYAFNNYSAKEFDLNSVELPDGQRNIPNTEKEGFRLFECIRIRTALQDIHPDGNSHFNDNAEEGDYQFWLEMGMAIHHASQGAKIGFDLWDEWSEQSKYYDKEELSEKWGSFSSVTGSITIATLFKKSRYHGQQPDLNAPNLRKWIKREVSHNLIEFNKCYAFINHIGKALIIYRVRSRNGLVNTKTSTLQNFKTLHSNKKLPAVKETSRTVKLEYKPLTTLWENSHCRRQYKEAEFEPFVGGDPFGTSLPTSNYYNYYTGLSIVPALGECDLIFSHIENIICNKNKELNDYVLNWIARMFQYPNKLGMTALVFRSNEGTGKGVIFEELLQKTFANHGVVFSDSAQLTDKFNEIVGRSVYIYCNEAVWAGDKSSVGRLKALITDEFLMQEEKQVSKSKGKNYTHLIISSNEEWVVSTGVSDRRFVMSDVGEDRIGDHNYFRSLLLEINSGGREAFAYKMLKRDITNFNPAERPRTDSFVAADQKIKGSCSIDQWWYDCLYEGQISPNIDHLLIENWDKETIYPNKTILYESFKSWCIGKPGQHQESNCVLTKHLEKKLGIKNT